MAFTHTNMQTNNNEIPVCRHNGKVYCTVCVVNSEYTINFPYCIRRGHFCWMTLHKIVYCKHKTKDYSIYYMYTIHPWIHTVNIKYIVYMHPWKLCDIYLCISFEWNLNPRFYCISNSNFNLCMILILQGSKLPGTWCGFMLLYSVYVSKNSKTKREKGMERKWNEAEKSGYTENSIDISILHVTIVFWLA